MLVHIDFRTEKKQQDPTPDYTTRGHGSAEQRENKKSTDCSLVTSTWSPAKKLSSSSASAC